MVRTLSSLCLLTALLVGCAATPAAAPPSAEGESSGEDGGPSGTFSFVFENDVFAESDNNFTNGASLSWMSSEVDLSGPESFLGTYVDFWSFLPAVGDEGTSNHVSFVLGQTFATATDISDPDPPLFDQPYAGLLAALTGLHARRGDSLHNWWLMAGMVGPSSYAEEVQKAIHELIDSDEPLGWDTQLSDEFVLNSYYDWKHRLATWDLSRAVAIDLTSSTGGGLGTAWIGAWGSLFARVGLNLPDNFGPSMPRTGLGGFPLAIQGPSEPWQVYAFFGADVQWVGRNIFLDGNTWTDSRSVDKEPFVAGGALGIGLQKGPVILTWSLNKLSDTYETQLVNNTFGALSLSVSI